MAQSEKTLMAKTKKELVAIILRKDDVEIKLQKELSEMQKERNCLDETFDHHLKYIRELEVSLKSSKALATDNMNVAKAKAYMNTKLRAKLIVWKSIAIAFAIATITIIGISLF